MMTEEKEKVCPVMSAGTKVKPCLKDECEWWNESGKYCKMAGETKR